MLLLAATALSWWLARDRPAALTVVNAMVGESHYRVDFRDEVIGMLRTNTEVTRRGIVLVSRFSVQMPGSAAIEVDERLEFAPTPPFALRRATQTSADTSVELRATATGFEVATGAGAEPRNIDLSYTLADHLALEIWLRFDAPAVGREIVTTALDFDRLAAEPKRYVVVERGDNSSGYVVRSAEVLEDKIVQLDRNLVAEAFSIAGIITLTRSDASQTVEHRTLTRAPALRVAIPAPIDQPQAVQRLDILVDAATARAFAQSTNARVSVTEQSGRWLLRINASETPPLHDQEIDDALAATLALPVGHSQIVTLAARIDGEQNDELLVRALLRAVHEYFEYDEHTRTVDLTTALLARRGDCTEFADLFTTLARTLGLPARSIVGLVYDDVAGPGFYLHAWSEVAIAGVWVAVDPTTGQMPVDATHIAFPSTDTGFLRAYSALRTMKFIEVKADYGRPPTKVSAPRRPGRAAASGLPDTQTQPVALRD